MREYELEVLEQYHIEPESTRKMRGAFFIDTKEGTMLLRETKISDRRALLLYTLLCRMESSGFSKVDTPVLTDEGKLVAKSRDGSRYMLKKWYDGRECEPRREQDIFAAAANLGRLHNYLYWQEICSVEEKQTIRPPAGRTLGEEFLCHNRELKKVRSFIRKQVNKGKFEYLFLESFEKMYFLAQQVTNKAEDSEYEKLYNESIAQNRLVHGDYNYHNVILMSQGIATTNFEHFRRDIQVQDLYYFMRKVMEKHHWRVSFGDAILNAYVRERSLNSRELEFMALKLAYPEKFWKTANTYYHSNKAWIPERSVEKLLLAVAQTEEKIRFLATIFSFHL